MKKIAIATYVNDLNYGALLQAYCLGTYLKKGGYDITYIMPSLDGKTIERVPERFLKKVFYFLVAKKRINKKRKSLNIFLNSYFKIITEKEFENNLCDFSALVCGSDQIWNVNITNGFNKLFFSEYNIYSIAYSASVGNISIVADNKDEFKKKIGNFNCVSARESNLSFFINKELGRLCYYTCDPVFLLEDELKKMCTDKKEEHYIFVYTMNKNKNIIKLAKRMSKKYKMPLILLNNNLFSYSFSSYKTIFSPSINEFLSLIRNADYVVTNSFHGTALSIIFEKQFLTLKSNSRNDRIENLLSTLKLLDRFVDDEIVDFESKIDYSAVNHIKSSFVSDSRKYLKESLESIK